MRFVARGEVAHDESFGRDKPTRVSSEAAGHNGGLANDGDAATCWQAAPDDHTSWWQVDLERMCEISSVKLSFPAAGNSATSIQRTPASADAVTSFVLADRMLRTRFAELRHLLNTGVVPRCVSNCDDLHNFVDWNMAGDAEELIESGEQISFDEASGAMAWPCTILNGVDRVTGWWLTRHAEPSLALNATAEQMAGLLCSCNPSIEQQVAERFLQMAHNEACEFLSHAAGHDGNRIWHSQL